MDLNLTHFPIPVQWDGHKMNIEAYRLQIGGHSQLIKSSDPTKLYKPLVENELKFYKEIENIDSDRSYPSIWQSLRKFIPGYHGTCEFQLKTAIKFNRKLPPIAKEESSQIKNELHNENHNDPFDRQNEVPGQAIKSEISPSISSDKDSIASENFTSSAIRPPLKIYNTGANASLEISNIESSKGGYEVLQYIVLDDLVYNYKKPCIMDIKMGQRQRKPGATKDKEQRQLQKSINSTSNRLSFRICGYLSYDKKDDTFCFRDKYWGREIDEKKVSKAILRWFWNGYEYQYDLMKLLCKKLKNFHERLSKFPHYRFWSSSLLCFFDGDFRDRHNLLKSLGIRMIDFANITYIEECADPDLEYLSGLRNLVKILKDLMSKLVKSKRVPQSLLSTSKYRFKNPICKNYPYKSKKLNRFPSGFHYALYNTNKIKFFNIKRIKGR